MEAERFFMKQELLGAEIAGFNFRKSDQVDLLSRPIHQFVINISWLSINLLSSGAVVLALLTRPHMCCPVNPDQSKSFIVASRRDGPDVSGSICP